MNLNILKELDGYMNTDALVSLKSIGIALKCITLDNL